MYFFLYFHSIEFDKVFPITRCVDCYKQEGIWIFPCLFEQSILLGRLQVEHDLFADAVDLLPVGRFEQDRVAAGSSLL